MDTQDKENTPKENTPKKQREQSTNGSANIC